MFSALEPSDIIAIYFSFILFASSSSFKIANPWYFRLIWLGVVRWGSSFRHTTFKAPQVLSAMGWASDAWNGKNTLTYFALFANTLSKLLSCTLSYISLLFYLLTQTVWRGGRISVGLCRERAVEAFSCCHGNGVLGGVGMGIWDKSR